MIDAIKRLFGKETTEVAPVQEASVDQEVMGMEAPRKRKGKGKKRAYTRKQKLTASVAPGKVVHATDATFQRLANVPGTPVLVDFWAEWCGPCKLIAPVLDEVAQELGAEARLLKVNVDQSPRTAESFSIRNIPTLIIMMDGEVMDVMVGLQSKGKLLKALKNQISKAA